MKQLKTKRELIGSLFIAFFLVGLLIPASILNGYSEIDNFTETQPTNLIDPVINDQQTESVNLDTWYLGESVKSDIEFSSQIPDESTLNYNADMQITDFQSSDIYRALSTGTWKVDLFFTARTVITEADIHFKVYCGGSGTLTIETGAKYGSGGSIFGTATGSDSESITSDDLDSLGYLYIQLRIIVHPGTEYITIYAWYYETGDYTLTQLFTATQDLGGITSHDQIQFNFYDCYFTRDTITNYVRSEYQYSSATTISHRLEIPSIRHAKELNIYYPESWSYSSINPYASVTDSSYTLTVNSPTELNYYLLFSSNCTNLLAVKDISTDHLADQGFEKGTKDDLSNIVTSPFDSFTVSTDIVSEGYYSLKGVDTEGTIDIFNFNIDYRGGVYFSFDYYLISGYTWADMYIYYRIDDSTWAYLNLAFGSSERWNKAFVYFELLGWDSGNNRNIVLQFSSGQGTVYIDNLRFFQTSTTIETLEPDKYEISSTLRSWDGYQNPSIPYEPLEFELWDRTSQTLEESYSTTTNSEGLATWTLERGLDLKEYELRAYSTDSYFGSAQTQVDVTNSVTNWILWNEDAGTETLTCIDSTIVFEFRETATANWEIQYNPSANFDISSSNILYYTYRSNVSSTLNYKWIKTDASNHILNQTDQSFTANIIYQFKDSFRHADYVETGTLDDSSIDIFYHRSNSPTGWIKVEIFDFRFINAQKLYFTPSYPEQIDYAETQLLDAWDFSEGDQEGFVHINTYSTLTISNGILIAENNTYNWGVQFKNILLSVDANYYTHMEIRLKTNASYEMTIYGLKESDGAYFWLTGASFEEYYFGNTYEVFNLDLKNSPSTVSYEWAGIEEYLGLLFTRFDYPTQLSEKTFIFIDYIKLVHIDDPVLYDSYYYFYLSSSTNTYSYNCYSDSNYLGVYSDLEPIAVNNSIGTHNFTYVLFTDNTEKAFIPVVYEVIYYNPEIDNYYLNIGNNYDLSGSLNVWIFTYWGNLTVDIFDNSTQLVDGVLEGDITTFYIVSEGYHNITVDLYNGASLWDSLEFGFIISSSIEIYTVHLDLFDQGGLGIPFEKVKCYMDSINDTNRLSQDFLTLDQNFTLYVTDYFNVTLTYFDVTLNYTLSTNYVDVEILLYEAQFTNRYNFAVTLQIIRNYHSHSFVLIANQTIAFWLTSGTYNITASALVNDEYESYSGSWTTTSEIKHYRIELDSKPTTTKKPINIVAFVVFIVQAGAIAGGLTFAYMNIFKPLKKEFFGFSLKSAFKHKKGQTWTTIIIAVIAIAMGGLYTLGG